MFLKTKIFIHGFKHNKLDKVVNYFLFAGKSDEIYQIDELFKFWSIKFLSK